MPSLFHVADAPIAERWHQSPFIDGKRRFEFGWIAHKAAASPVELGAAHAAKLFAGGACAYLDSPDAGLAGLIQGEVYLKSIDRFRVFRTETRL